MPINHSQNATKQYATLRGAVRALSHAPEATGGFDVESRFREIRGWIQRRADSTGDDSQTSTKIDSALAEINTEMLAVIARVSFWQFRAILPAVRAESPADLEALLQVCLSEPTRRWSDLVDYLVTLLATREVEGRKQIDCDPTSVSTYLQEICSEAAGEATEESLALAATIGEAREALAAGEPISEIVQRVRDLKHGSEKLLFVPDVLRSVVEFNVAVSNRVLQQQEVQRSLDQAELELLSESESEPGSAQAAEKTDSNALPAFGSFELEAVESALHVRLERGVPVDSPAHRLVAKVEISKLNALEKGAFRDRSDARISRIIRSVVTIGLIVRHVDQVRDELAELGIDGDWLSRSSAGEIDKLAQTGIRELTRGGKFDQAQQLAELRARYLNPLFDEDLLLRPTVTSTPAAPDAREPRRPSSTRAPRSTKSTGPGKRRNQKHPNRKKKNQVKGESRSGMIGVSIGVVLAVIAGTVFVMSRSGDASNAKPYTNAQLGEISEYLTRGHTSIEGGARVFTGTVNPAWSRIPSDTKRQRAIEIGALLEKKGIPTVMFYDLGQRLQLHYERGSVRYLE